MPLILELPELCCPDEVTDFVREHDLSEYLPKLWSATAQQFSVGDLHAEWQPDPEDSGLAWIVFVVQNTRMSSDEMTSAARRWREVRAAICPSPDVRSLFTLQIWD